MASTLNTNTASKVAISFNVSRFWQRNISAQVPAVSCGNVWWIHEHQMKGNDDLQRDGRGQKSITLLTKAKIWQFSETTTINASTIMTWLLHKKEYVRECLKHSCKIHDNTKRWLSFYSESRRGDTDHCKCQYFSHRPMTGNDDLKVRR